MELFELDEDQAGFSLLFTDTLSQEAADLTADDVAAFGYAGPLTLTLTLTLFADCRLVVALI